MRFGMSTELGVGLVGAGIGGLSAALFLAQAGWRVRLFERELALSEVGAGLQLSPNATRLLRHINILDAVSKVACEPQALGVRAGTSGRVLVRNAMGDALRARYGAPFLTLHRGDLQRALFEAVRAHPAIDCVFGHRLIEVSDFDSQPRAVFETEQGPVSAQFAALIGADGVWSRARTLIGLPGPNIYSGKTAWRARVLRDDAPAFARINEVALWLGPGAHLVHYPVRGGAEINIVAIIAQEWREPVWSAPGERAELLARFAGWAPQARDLLAAAPGFLRWALCARSPEAFWSRGAMALLGDAAHPMLPFLAQGAGSAIEDGDELARHLRPGREVAPALRSYAQARLPRTVRLQHAARRQSMIYHLRGPAAFARDTAFSLLPEGALFRTFDWIYEA